VPDFEMCTTDDCPLRNQCYRYSATPEENQKYRRFIFVSSFNRVRCDKIIPLERCPTIMPNDAQNVAFNSSLQEKLQKALPANVRRRRKRATKEQTIQLVLIAAQMLEEGAGNSAIVRRCQEEVGLPLSDKAIWHLRNGTYRGWGADKLYVRKRETADVPPAESSAEKVKVKSTSLAIRTNENPMVKEALRALVVVMDKEGLAKVCIDEKRRVTISKIEISEWTLD
jgi:hypothetical protein